MFKKITCSFLLILLLAGFGQQAYECAASANQILETGHWSYPYIERLLNRGVLEGLPYNVKPYRRSQVAEALLKAAQSPEISTDRWIIDLLCDEFAFDIERLDVPDSSFTDHHRRLWIRSWLRGRGQAAKDSTRYQGRYDIEITFDLSPESVLSAYSKVSNDDLPDSSFGGKPTRGLLYEMREAYFLHDGRWFTLMMGRFPVVRGAGRHGTLMLSYDTPPLDQIQFNVDWKFLTFRSLWSALPDLEHYPKIPEPGTRELVKRYYFTHRVDTQWDFFALGISEHVIYTGIDLPVQWSYVNPLVPYYATMQNRSESYRSNILYTFDLTLFPRRGIRIFAEGLVDDYQVDEGDQGRGPNSFAWLAGTEISFGAIDLGVEYARVDPWTYNNVHEYQEFLYRPGPYYLGYPLGSDAVGTTLYGAVYLARGWVMRPMMRLLRFGEISLDTPYNGFNQSDLVAPSGIVEDHTSFQLEFSFQPAQAIRAAIVGGIDLVNNAGHISGKSDDNYMVMAGLWWKIFEHGW